MTTTGAEERKRIREKRLQKRKRNRKLIGISLCILFIVVACITIISCFGDDTYRSEKEFKEHVSYCFSKNDYHRVKDVQGENTIIAYGDPLSVALKYPKTGNSVTDAYLKDVAESVQEDFYKEYDDVEDEEKYLKLMDYAIYESPKSAISVVLIQEDQQKIDGEMVTIDTEVHSYNFSTKTGSVLTGVQIFNTDYREFVSEYLQNYFEKMYEQKLVEGYEDEIKVSGDTLNNFALTDYGASFFFQPGTILDKEEGFVQVEIPYTDLDGTIREDVVSRAIDPERPMVALTYDDGPYPKTGNRILDCLEKNGVVATFFEVGKNVKNFPEVTKREAELGMEIGNHSWSHPELTDLKKKEIKSEISKTNEEIKDATGEFPTLLRPPYGSVDDKVLKAADMPAILWSVDTLDWKSRKAKSVVKVIKKVEEKDGLDGRVVLMHSIYESTAEATEEIVPWLLEQGYQLVTVSEMLEYRYDTEPKDGKLYGYDYFYAD